MKKKSIIILISAVVVIGGIVAGVFAMKPSTDVEQPETIESTVEPTTEPTVEPTVEPTTEPTYSATLGTVSGYDNTIQDETQAPEIESESNGGHLNPSHGTEDTTYCTFEDLETPKTLYAKYDFSLFGNPNLYEGELVTEGGLCTNDEFTVNSKVVYDSVEYYAFKSDTGFILMTPAESLSETPVEIKQETPSTELEQQQPTEQTKPSTGNSSSSDTGYVNPNYPAGSKASTMTDAEVQAAVETLKNAGKTDEQINRLLFSGGSGTNYVNGGQGGRDSSTYTDEELEAIRKASGMVTE